LRPAAFRAGLRRLLLGGATAYSLLWCCLAPVLAYCTCTGTPLAYSYRGHVDRACEAHHGCHPESMPSDSDEHHHDDDPVSSDQIPSAGAHPAAATPSMAWAWDDGAPRESGARARDRIRCTTGPPRSVRAALACTVLLV